MIFAALALVPSDRLSRRLRAVLLAAPLLAAAAWAVHVHARLGGGHRVVEFDLPFVGYAQTLQGAGLGDAVAATLLLLLCVAIAWRWWRRRSLLLTAALPFVVLFPLLSFAVLGLATNALRALGPALTLFWIDIYATLTRPAR